MILIGLGHKCRQGKNFVANYMKEQNPSIKLYAFADELKLYCKGHHDNLKQWWEGEHLDQQLLPPKDDPIYGYTQILQWYGTDVARKHNPDVWVQALETRLALDTPEFAIVTDVRFPNEAAFIKKAGGFLVEVIRLNAEGTQYIDPGRDPNHPSEVSLDGYEGYDFTISVKDGDLKALKRHSIGAYNIVKSIEKDEHLYENFVDEPDYADDIMESIDSQGDGFKESGLADSEGKFNY